MLSPLEERRLLRSLALVVVIVMAALLLHWRFLYPDEHETLTTFLLQLISGVGCAVIYAAWRDWRR